MQPVRYHGFAQAMHWLTVIALCVQLPFVWVAQSLPPGAERSFWFTMHKSTGLTILLLILLRITWRWAKGAPPSPKRIPRWMQFAAHISHGLLYAILLVMPITGFLVAGNGRPISFYGLFNIPSISVHPALADMADSCHVLGQLMLYAMVIVHVGAVVWHSVVRRDGVLYRLLPRQENYSDDN